MTRFRFGAARCCAAWIVTLSMLSLGNSLHAQCPPGQFMRGDLNNDGSFSFVDIILMGQYLSDPAIVLARPEAADANDNGHVEMCDFEAMISFIVIQGPGTSLPAPVFSCGTDSTPPGPLPSTSGDIVMTVGDATAALGDTNVSVAITMTNVASVTGLTLRGTYDETALTNVQFTGVLLPDPFFSSAFADSGEFVFATSADTFLNFPLDPSTDATVGTLSFDIDPMAAAPTVVSVDLVDDESSTPPRLNLACSFGTLIRPTLNSGSVTITGSPDPQFRRVDCDQDGNFALADMIEILGVGFSGNPTTCASACDADDSGALSLGDAIYSLQVLFVGAPGFAPYPGCGVDPMADSLDCSSYGPCAP